MSEEKTNIRPVPLNELSIDYEIGLQSSLDARLTVDNVEMLNEPQSWYRIKRGQKIAVGYKGMPVSCKEDASLYILQSDAAELTSADWAKVATQEWVEAQGYGQGSGGGADLTKYATKDWVEEQGFVTASYLDGILTLSSEAGTIGTLPEDTTINELLDAKADNVPFTLSQAYVTNPIGGYADRDDIAGKTVKEILTKLLGIVEKINAPTITVNSGGMSMTIKNNNNFPVTVEIVSNSWEGQVRQTGDMYENHMGSYDFEGSVFTLDANSSITKTNGWDSASGILEITSYSLSCYFEAYGIVSTTESKNKI